MQELKEVFTTITALRDKETGCPWDREQTFASLLKPLREEVAELVDAVSKNDQANIAEELGDTLWNVLMLLEVAEEEGIASKTTIIAEVNKKMIGRHPHVFGELQAHTPEEAHTLYKQAKEKLKKKQPHAT